jgi:hypothetical protein
MVISCSEFIVPDDNINSSMKNENVVALLDRTTVRLFDGVEEGDIGLTYDGRVEKLKSNLSSKYGRSVEGSDRLSINEADIIELIQSRLSTIIIPEILVPTEDDIVFINQDFPELTNEEIIVELETIRRIYQDQLGSLVFNDFIGNSDYDLLNQDSARKIGYSEGTFYYDDDSITIYEIGAILSHPLSAITLNSQKEKTFNLTQQYMGAKERTDDKLDAFRHAVLNIVMAKEGFGLKKEKLAWANDFTTAHEKGTKYIGIPSEMDLHNNLVGRRYYDANSSKKYTKILFISIETGVSEPSYDTACKAMKNKAINASFVDKKLSDAKNKISAIAADILVYIVTDTIKY